MLEEYVASGLPIMRRGGDGVYKEVVVAVSVVEVSSNSKSSSCSSCCCGGGGGPSQEGAVYSEAGFRSEHQRSQLAAAI
jgi:hypothetical protein